MTDAELRKEIRRELAEDIARRKQALIDLQPWLQRVYDTADFLRRNCPRTELSGGFSALVAYELERSRRNV